MAKRSDGIETKKKILGAAAKLFSENGFKQTSNADISKASGVNSALISYYFGDKETIYREAWQHSLRESLAKYPPDGGVPATAPARKRLYGIISATVRRYSDHRHCFDGGISNEDLRMSVYSIVAMCISPQKKIQRIEKTEPFPYDVEKRIEHVFRFSVAGLNAIKRASRKN